MLVRDLQRLFHPFASLDVDELRDRVAAARFSHVRDAEQEPKLLAGGVEQTRLGAVGVFAALAQRLQCALDAALIVMVHKLLYARVQQPRPRVACGLAQRAVDAQQATGVRAERDHGAAERRVVEGAARLLLSAALRRAELRVAELCVHHGREAAEMVLADIVCRPLQDRCGCGLFADRVRDDDQRRLAAARGEYSQRGEGVKAGQDVIAEHDIPVLFGERLRHLIGVLDPPPAHALPGILECAHVEHRVVL